MTDNRFIFRISLDLELAIERGEGEKMEGWKRKRNETGKFGEKKCGSLPFSSSLPSRPGLVRYFASFSAMLS